MITPAPTVVPPRTSELVTETTPALTPPMPELVVRCTRKPTAPIAPATSTAPIAIAIGDRRLTPMSQWWRRRAGGCGSRHTIPRRDRLPAPQVAACAFRDRRGGSERHLWVVVGSRRR